jgi:hypothetical protein
MKGMFRLALSSYIAVAVGCSPALAHQEPGIAPARLVSMSAVGMESSAAARAVRLPRHASAEAAVRLPHASSAAADTLTVAVRGPAAVRSAAVPSYRAEVENGSSGSRYYFWWFAADCARRIGCAPSSYTLVAEGLGRDSVALPVGAVNAERNLVVQVAELDGTGRTGSSPMFVIIGPAQRADMSASATGRSSCDWFAGSFYPHTGDFTDPYSGRTWPRKFRRDYCGNRVQWDPEG